MRFGAALAALACTWVLAVPVFAHEEIGGVRNVLEDVEPALPGVTIQVRISVADQLVVANPTPTELAVIGERGEPFLRIGPDGAFANLRSPTWYRSNDPTGGLPVSPRADASASPEWVRIAREAAWGWFDHRLHRVQLGALPPGSKAVTLERWTVPMRYGDNDVVVRGRREYRPVRGAFQSRIIDQLPGASATILPGVMPGIFLQVTGDQTVTLFEDGGVAFARVGRSGAEVNEASTTWALSVAVRSGKPPEGDVGPGVAPRWRRLARDAQLAWLEPRARYPGEEPSKDVLEAGREQVVRRWSVPARVGGQRRELAGTTSWVPTHRTGSSAPILPVVAGGVVLVLAVVGIGWRRRRRLS